MTTSKMIEKIEELNFKVTGDIYASRAIEENLKAWDKTKGATGSLELADKIGRMTEAELLGYLHYLEEKSAKYIINL